MGGHAVVQERRREEHLVAPVPEVGVVLMVEDQVVPNVVHAESAAAAQSAKEPKQQAGVVQRAVVRADEAGQDRAGGRHEVVGHYKPDVEEAHNPAEGMLAVLTRADLEVVEQAAKETGALGEALVDKVLQAGRVGQDPLLEALGHLLVCVSLDFKY